MKRIILTSIMAVFFIAAAFGLLTGEVYAAERAIWVWGMADDIVLNTNNAQTDFFNFCAAPHGDASKAITLVFLDPKPYGVNLMSATPVNYAAQLRAFLSAASSAGIKVEALSGDKSWATPEGRAAGEALIDEITAFNLGGTSTQRFTGIQYDVEPYLLKTKTDNDPYDWDYDRALVWSEYLTLLANCQTKINNYNAVNNPDIRFGAAIPRWYTPGSTNGPEPIIDRVDYVAIMDYRETSGQIIADAQDEINYAVTKNKKVYIGIETTHPTDTVDFPPSTTFYEEGNTAMETELAAVNSTLSAYSSYAGIAIHYYEDLTGPKGTEISYRSLTAGARAYHYPIISVRSPNRSGEIFAKSVNIQWAASDIDGDTVTIKIEYSPNGGSSWTTLTDSASNTGNYLWNTTGLSAGSNYLVRITGTAGGLSFYDLSNSAFAVSGTVTQTAITNLHLWNESSSSLRLKWTPPSCTPRYYKIYRSVNGAAFPSTPTYDNVITINTYIDTGLSSTNKYKYQIRAVYGDGATGSVSNSSNTLIPGAGFLIDYFEGSGWTSSEGITYGGPYGAGLTAGFSTTNKIEGSRSMQLTFGYVSGWGGIEIGTFPVKLDMSPYNAIKISVNGGVLNQKSLAIQFKETGRTEGNETWQSSLITTTDTAWTEYTVNFSEFTRVDVEGGSGNSRFDTHTIGSYGLLFNSQSASGTNTYYVDKIYLGNTAATVDVPLAEYAFGEIMPSIANHRFRIGPIPVSYGGYSAPWTVRIWTNNGGTAGLRGADGVIYIPLKAWCANYGPTSATPDEENDYFYAGYDFGDGVHIGRQYQNNSKEDLYTSGTFDENYWGFDINGDGVLGTFNASSSFKVYEGGFWYRVPEYSEMDPGNIYTWRRLVWSGAELTNPFDIYLAIDAVDATTQYYQTTTLTVEYINE